MDIKKISILSKFEWYRNILIGYDNHLKSKKIPKEKREKLTILLSWSIDYIFYNFNWETYYPKWRKDIKTGNPINIKNSFSKRVKFSNKKNNIFIKRIYHIIKSFTLNIVINMNFNFIKNIHNVLYWDNIRFIIFKKLIDKTSFEAKLEKESFIKGFEKDILDKRLFNCIFSVLPNEFFDFKTKYGHLVLNISCEKLIYPEMIKLLNRCESTYITHYSHGAVTGWYINNYIENKTKSLSDQFINWDINDKSTITRYYIKPKDCKESKIYWITRPELNQIVYDMIPNIGDSYKYNLNTHFDEIFYVIKEFGFHFLLHPKGLPKEYKKYLSNAISLGRFNPKNISKNDIFIFDSINSSLIFYALKHSLKFLIYESYSPIKTTEMYKNIEKYLKKRDQLFFNNVSNFKEKLKSII